MQSKVESRKSQNGQAFCARPQRTLLPAEVKSDPEPSTPLQGSAGGELNNRREFGKERKPLLSPPIGDADWCGDSRLVVVVLDEFNLRVNAKEDGRAANFGSHQKVQLLEQSVPLDLDAIRNHERPIRSPINGHYVRPPKLTAQDGRFVYHAIQAERAWFLNAWTGHD
jgi:hypothetical protein